MRISDWSSDVCSSDLPGDFVQALMDLGAGICTPRSPACAICPVMADCRARGRADIERLPVKPAKKAKPQRHGVAHWIERDGRSEEHTSELQSLMRISYAVFCLKKKNTHKQQVITTK